MISLAGHTFGRRHGLTVCDRLGGSGRAACRVERDTVCIDLPACYERQVARHRGREVVFPVTEIPPDEMISLAGHTGGCLGSRTVCHRRGCRFRAACRVERDTVCIDLPAGFERHVFADCPEGVFLPAEEPAEKCIPLAHRILRRGQYLPRRQRDGGGACTVSGVKGNLHRFVATDKGGDRQCGEEHQYRKGDDVLFLFHKCLRLTARFDSSGGHFFVIIV